jgi:2'-5' RNA ligase
MDKFASGDSARLFLAAVPNAGTAERIHRLAGVLRRAHKFDGKLIPPERLQAAADVRAERFGVSFDRTVSFRGRSGNRPFVLIGDDGLGRLQSFRRMLGAALTRRGLRRVANTHFTPHVTLLYDARSADEHPIEPIFWTVTEFVLIHSRKGHDYLARWSLQA